MKVSGFWPLFLVVGTTLLFSNFSSPTSGSWYRDLVATSCGHGTTSTAVSRKLKENVSGIRSSRKGDIGHVTLDDYHSMNSVPSSMASVEPGPIEHGTPLMPFIPKAPPPRHPMPGNFN